MIARVPSGYARHFGDVQSIGGFGRCKHKHSTAAAHRRPLGGTNSLLGQNMQTSRHSRWRNSQVAVCTLVIGTVFLSCRSTKRVDLPPAYSNPYFPVDSGSVWVYVDKQNPRRSLFREVKATQIIAGRSIAVLEESECVEGTADRVRTWRIEIGPNGEVYASAPSIAEGESATKPIEAGIDTARSLLFKTSATPGEQWRFAPGSIVDASTPPAIGSAFHVRCERMGEFTLSNGWTYNDCVLFSSNEHEDGVEYVLARGTGLISIISHAPGGVKYELCAQRLHHR